MKQKKPNLSRVLDFQKLMGQFSQIERHSHRKRGTKFVSENDTEHSYDLAMTAWFISQYFPELDSNKIIRLALVHDLVEIYAGDVFAHSSAEEQKKKLISEAKSIKKIVKDWPDFPEMLGAIKDYEKRDTPEARFVYALDKIMPPMLIYINDGYSWRANGVTVKMFYDNKVEKMKLSPEIFPYFDELYELLLTRPDLIKRV
ncbi:HD domain-containing protein [Candidatus Saccharibacteria bacterium]|nr:HD domain-containing protein [Candidatus Saccharibacteria bacterium]